MRYPLLFSALVPIVRARINEVQGIENIPHDTNFIIAANHNSWMDSPLVVGCFSSFLGKKTYFLTASHRWGFLGALPIDEKNKKGVLDVALEFLKKGENVCVFPEGNSNPSATLRPGKTGAARLYLWSQLPVLPVGISGLKGISAPVSVLKFFLFWRKITVRIGKPIFFEEYRDKTIDYSLLRACTHKIMSEIARLCDKKLL